MDYHQAKQALSQPLQFGNPAQIEALRLIYPPEVNNEGKKRYRVEVSVSFDDTIYVYAEDEAEAKALAVEGFDIDDCDVEYSVREYVE